LLSLLLLPLSSLSSSVMVLLLVDDKTMYRFSKVGIPVFLLCYFHLFIILCNH
jgi:hypothetical protein